MKRLLGLLLLLGCGAAQAHKPSDSYLSLDITDSGIAGRWDIALRDLDHAIGLDGNDDGLITWGELRAREAAVGAYALARLSLASAGRPCPAAATGLRVDEHTDGGYAVLGFEAACAARPARLTVDYRLLFDLDPQHRGLLRLIDGAATRTAVFGPANGRQDFDLGGDIDALRAVRDYAEEGVWHIWIGFDHILFLLSLLLPAVLMREAGRWRPAAQFRAAFWDAVRVATAFTLAHSVTLSLAVLGYVALSSRWVESAIAASVAAAALNNLVPLLYARRALLAFGFGLVHGLGFANVLMDLNLPASLRLLGLLGFNLGVEAGQLAIVAGFLPVAYGVSRSAFYPSAVLRLGSAVIAVVACLWFAERAFGLRVFALPEAGAF